MRWVERFLWLLAIVGIGTALFGYGEGWIWQSYLNHKFDESLWSQQVRQRAPENAATDTALRPSIGRLEIPRLHISVMLLEGVGSRTLLRGIGHIPGTALPGESGNIGIAGHRDTFFRGLYEIRKSDHIVVTTMAGRYEYSVDSTQIVQPSDLEVLADSGRQVLTLVTCYPFWIAGPAPNRFVVQASLTQ